MESTKRNDSDKMSTSDQNSADEQDLLKSRNESEENSNNDVVDSSSRKRKILAEPEVPGIADVSEKTILVPKEENTSVSADNPPELYGLKPEFLKSLGINVPVGKWVYVNNFRCDKNELKEVFDLAGHVVLCSVVGIRERYANIMYSHPLEAVQAVSMFNGQTLYGMKLKVTMINPPSDSIILPKGLKDVGPGLGFNGRPLRDVVNHYKKYIKQKKTLLDTSIFCSQNDEDVKFADSKHNDSDIRSTGDNTDVLNCRKFFKITSVVDLMAENTEGASVPETQSKKPKCNEPDNDCLTGKDSPDTRVICDVGPVLIENNNISQNDTAPKDPLSTPNWASASSSGPQNYQPISQPTGLQFQANPNLNRSSIGPFVPTGRSLQMSPSVAQAVPVLTGPSRPIRPYGQSGPPIQSVGPNMPMMGPVGPNGPMVAPLGRNGPMGSYGPPNGPMAPPSSVGPSNGPVGPRVMGPTGPGFGPFGPGPNMPPAVPGTNPAVGDPRIRAANSSGPHQQMPNDVTTLYFRNLPPSTTFPLLCEKVSQCGPLLSLQLLTPGCAVARFAHRIHAETCFQIFNGKCIDGCVIEARFA